MQHAADNGISVQLVVGGYIHRIFAAQGSIDENIGISGMLGSTIMIIGAGANNRTGYRIRQHTDIGVACNRRGTIILDMAANNVVHIGTINQNVRITNQITTCSGAITMSIPAAAYNKTVGTSGGLNPHILLKRFPDFPAIHPFAHSADNNCIGL